MCGASVEQGICRCGSIQSLRYHEFIRDFVSFEGVYNTSARNGIACDTTERGPLWGVCGEGNLQVCVPRRFHEFVRDFASFDGIYNTSAGIGILCDSTEQRATVEAVELGICRCVYTFQMITFY